MATTISIQVGAISGSRTFTNDTKARDTLLNFYTAHRLGPPDATNAQKLQAVVNWLVAYIQDRARVQAVETASAAARTQAESDYAFE
jgi:hypothetical protein